MAPSAQTRKSNATRQTILDAALRVIALKGYSAATVDEIVKEAGVSKGLAYYHFKSKADMGKSILGQGISNLTGEFHKIANNAPDATSALHSMLEYFTRTMVENRAFGKFFLSELWRSGRVWSTDIREADQNLVLLLGSQIERGRRSLSTRPRFRIHGRVAYRHRGYQRFVLFGFSRTNYTYERR